MNKQQDVLCFIDLLKKHRVEIPIIQRDYAQGRKNSLSILRHFLNALKQSLDEKKEVRLDFIYGDIVDGCFQPLDGQQRLTTLFLLHWYAYMKEKRYNEENRELLLKFSYETRISSRDFCKALVENCIEINIQQDRISDIIIDANWFFLSWKKDPTIKAMLNAIDEIHYCFKGNNNLWEELVKQKYISFYYVELENIGLTDDLYIKMNARGKLLTNFEHFKADLQKKCTEQLWESDRNAQEKFSFKIDTKWTDWFWKYFKKDNKVDIAHMAFMTSIIMVRIVLERHDDRISLVQKLQDNTEFINSSLISLESFQYIEQCYDLYAQIDVEDEKFQIPFPMWRHEIKRNILSSIIFDESKYIIGRSDSSYTLKVIFFAHTEYLLRNKKFDHDRYLEWMRVVRNIVSRADVDRDGKRSDIIRSPQTFIGVINLINELAEGCNDIYRYLNSTGTIKSTFAKEQVEEERIKAKLIQDNPDIKTLLWKVEDNQLLRGSIKFVLYCVDYDKNRILDLELVTRIQKVFELYFNDEEEKITPNLRRAFLCTSVDGVYEFYNYWWSRWTVNSMTKRKLLDNYRELEYIMYNDEKEYFKNLILNLTDCTLEDYVNSSVLPDSMPNWKKRLIKDEQILDSAKSNYIAISEDNSCCYILKSRRPRDMEGCLRIE